MRLLSSGTTLIEVLVIVFIIGVLSTTILLNYRTGQAGALLTRAAASLESDLRRAQNLAIGSAELNGTIPCGFGIHYLDQRNYSIYAGGLEQASACQSSDHNFQSGIDSVYQDTKIIEPTLVFKNAFSDIFFEPPDPATYINNSKSAGLTATIELCLETDLARCRSLTIDTAGRIVTQ